MNRHNLYDVDLKRKIAFCTKCGYTEIYIPSTRRQAKPKAICIAKAREIWQRNRDRQKLLRKEKRSQTGWRPIHFLSEVDSIKLTAICAVCGPTEIRKTSKKGGIRIDCATKVRGYMRKYRRSRYIARSTNLHALSMVDEARRTAICAKCGPVSIELRLGKKKIIRRCINARREPAKSTLGI